MSKPCALSALREGQHFEAFGKKGVYVERLPGGISVRLREAKRDREGVKRWYWREDTWSGSTQVLPDYAPSCQPIRCGKNE